MQIYDKGVGGGRGEGGRGIKYQKVCPRAKIGTPIDATIPQN